MNASCRQYGVEDAACSKASAIAKLRLCMEVSSTDVLLVATRHQAESPFEHPLLSCNVIQLRVGSFLACRLYGVEDAASGKAAAKAELRQRMELSSADVPLVAVITRLTHQKGIHLIKHAAWQTLKSGAQFVLLGSAPDPRVQVGYLFPHPQITPDVEACEVQSLGQIFQHSHFAMQCTCGNTWG